MKAQSEGSCQLSFWGLKDNTIENCLAVIIASCLVGWPVAFLYHISLVPYESAVKILRRVCSEDMRLANRFFQQEGSHLNRRLARTYRPSHMAKLQIYILYIKNEQKRNVEITHTVEHLLTVCVQEAVIPEHPSSTETRRGLTDLLPKHSLYRKRWILHLNQGSSSTYIH